MIDLHSHSTISDGSKTPEQVVELAALAGCSAVALTDHDSVEGVPAATARAEELGIRVVAGCEVSCSWLGQSAHVLCYFVDESPSPLVDELENLANDRAARNLLLVDRLVELGVLITYDEVLAEAGGKGIGRPHFAAVLVRHKAATSIQDAFDKWLGRGGRAYIPKARIEPLEIAAKAVRSGAVAVLAHPLSTGLSLDELDGELAALANGGFVGLECYYGRYDRATRADLVRLAHSHGLVPTGGSDFHGSYKPDLAMGIGTGDLVVPDEALDQLEERLKER